MLYKPSVVVEPIKQDFLFDAQPYNEDIDIREVAAIQSFYEKNGYIPEKYIPQFLNWLTYSARMNVTNPLESVMDSSFAGRCALAQDFFVQIFKKLNLENMIFNVGDILGTESIHALTCVQIPTRHNGQDTNKLFVLDPTFRQFCISEENRFERYYEKPRWAVKMSTPHPGYFFNLTDEGKAFAENLISYGYFEVTEDSLKTYFDAFALYVTPKEAYTDPSHIGRASSTTATGSDYWEWMCACRARPLNYSRDFDLDTPKETVEREDNKLRNKIRRALHREELSQMLIEDDASNLVNNNINNSTK